MELKKTVLKFALHNAVQFKGKASVGAVIGRVLADAPELKKDITLVSKAVQQAVNDVNALSPDEQSYQLKNVAPELMQKKKAEKRGLPELKNAVVGKVVTRLPPEPSKHLHIGHALSFLINYLYAEKYRGKCVLRFEDTNPEKCSQEFVDSVADDLDFLGIKTSKTVFVSNDLLKMYGFAERLIRQGNAYVCFCERKKVQDLRHKGIECGCRGRESLLEWKKMLEGAYKEGECVLRLKLDMSSENQVLRDPVIFRICKKRHYLQKNKYVVWPLYDFENAVEDELCSVTHILRSIEFGEMRVELQNRIKDLLGFRKQGVRQYGRFNVVGAITQGRDIRQMIEEKKFSGWDDPRLVTIKALRRRGIQKSTFYELAVDVGLSTTPTNIDWSIIASINRKLIDKKSNRHFFVENPKKIVIKGSPKKQAEVKLHPEDPKRGARVFKTNEGFFAAGNDCRAIRAGELVRLMDCLNFVKKGKGFVFDSQEYEKYRGRGKRIIQWLPADEKNIRVEIVMPDASVKKGLGEKDLKSLKVGDIIQFNRVGFCRLDKKEKNRLVFWFSHD